MTPDVHLSPALSEALNQPLTCSKETYAERVELSALVSNWKGAVLEAQKIAEHPDLNKGIETLDGILLKIMSGELDPLLPSSKERQLFDTERDLRTLARCHTETYRYVINETNILGEYQRFLNPGWDRVAVTSIHDQDLEGMDPNLEMKLVRQFKNVSDQFIAGRFTAGLPLSHDTIVSNFITPGPIKFNRSLSRIIQILALGKGVLTNDLPLALTIMATTEVFYQTTSSFIKPEKSMRDAYIFESVLQHHAERGANTNLVMYLANKKPDFVKNILTLRALRLMGERLEYIDQLFFTAKDSQEFQHHFCEVQAETGIKTAEEFFTFLRGLNATQNILGCRDRLGASMKMISTVLEAK